MMNKHLLVISAITLVALVGYFSVNSFRTEHGVFLTLWFGLLAIPRTRFIGLVLTPGFLFSLAYDSLRVFAESAARRVSLTLVPEWEVAIFGFMPPSAIEVIHNPVLDVIAGPVYTSHVIVVALMAGWLLFQSREHYDDPGWRDYFHSFFWGFFLMNLCANIVQVAWPVAPPWYLGLYGPVAPDAPVAGSAAGLLRTDAVLGIKYFENAYSVASYTFGAMPSLHVAMPAWVALHMRSTTSRLTLWFFTFVMSFYAVYLNHHFILDLVAGVALAGGVYWVVHYGPLKGWATATHQWLSEAFTRQADE